MSLIKKVFGGTESRGAAVNYGALFVGPPTFALLALHPHVAAVAVVADSIPDAQFTPRTSAIDNTGLSLASMDPVRLPEWGYKQKFHAFVRLQPHDVDPSLPARAKLAVARIEAVTQVIAEINWLRTKIGTGLAFQETIYLTKKMQAEKFKLSGYDESMLMSIPYVVQYADLTNVSLREAADSILFNAELDDAFLSKTETLRLRYFDRIKRETESDKIPEIVRQFMLDCHSKQLV